MLLHRHRAPPRGIEEWNRSGITVSFGYNLLREELLPGMANHLRSTYRLFRAAVRTPRQLPRFVREWRAYQRLNTLPSMKVRFNSLWPVLHEYQSSAGLAADYYFHQDLWAARKIYEARPRRHVDVGSRIDGFIAHLLVFMPVEYVDIRPLPPVRNLTVVQADATRLDMFADNSLPSLSSLNVAEHFGLGRYSDPIDPAACFTFMSALARTLAPEGRLYFAAPVGRERVEFNAHRVFSLETVLAQFRGLRLVSFSYVDDAGHLHEEVEPASFPQDSEFACGLFEFTKERQKGRGQ